MVGLTYDKFHVGDKFTDSRTVTEAHLLFYLALTGDFNSYHVNDEYAKKSKFGSRIAYGFLTMILSTGVLGNVTDRTSIGYLGLTDVKMMKPVRIGDTLTTDFEVVAKKDVPKWNGGAVTYKQTVRNQNGEIVLEATHAIGLKNEVD